MAGILRPPCVSPAGLAVGLTAGERAHTAHDRPGVTAAEAADSPHPALSSWRRRRHELSAGWGESAASAAVTPGRSCAVCARSPAVSPTANPAGETQGGLKIPAIVPATPAQAAPVLAPVGVDAVAPALFPAPLPTSLKVRRMQLNVLADHTGSVAGSLLEAHHPARPGRA